jgi:hypothetical protein
VGTDQRDEEEVRYLTADDVIGLHADILGCTDREAADQSTMSNGRANFSSISERHWRRNDAGQGISTRL